MLGTDNNWERATLCEFVFVQGGNRKERVWGESGKKEKDQSGKSTLGAKIGKIIPLYTSKRSVISLQD